MDGRLELTPPPPGRCASALGANIAIATIHAAAKIDPRFTPRADTPGRQLPSRNIGRSPDNVEWDYPAAAQRERTSNRMRHETRLVARGFAPHQRISKHHKTLRKPLTVADPSITPLPLPEARRPKLEARRLPH